jgi:ATP-binding cassette subfamily B protein
MADLAAADAPTVALPSWRYAWSLFRFRPKRQLINLAGVLLGWSADVLLGLAARDVFDHLAVLRPGGSLRWLAWPLLVLVLRSLAQTIVPLTLQTTNGRFAFANGTRLQRNVLRRVLELPGARPLPGSTGEAVSRLRDDAETVMWWPIGFNNVIGSTVSGTLALVIMWRVSPLMTVGVLLPLVAVVTMVEVARTRVVAYRRANRESTAQVTGFLGDVCAAATGIQVAEAQDRVVAHLRALGARRPPAAVRDRLLEEALKGAFWVVNLGTGAVLVVAGRALRSHRITVGDLALFVAYLSIYENAVRDLGGGLAGYRQLGVSFDRLHRLLGGAPARRLLEADEIFERGPLPAAAPPELAPTPFAGLHVRGLGYRHPARPPACTGSTSTCRPAASRS